MTVAVYWMGGGGLHQFLTLSVREDQNVYTFGVKLYISFVMGRIIGGALDGD